MWTGREGVVDWKDWRVCGLGGGRCVHMYSILGLTFA